jgi:uncharacterized protein YbjT (DUF2867 family)
MLLAVVGATGKQGGSVIDAAPEAIAIRAVVRDRAKAPRVAEIVEADLDDVESLSAAFAGADAAYCVTPGGERETERACNMAIAARNAGVAHVVWSTQEDTRPVVGGRYTVPSYDAKADADDTFRELGVPTTFMRTCFYWESLLLRGIGPGGDGVIRWPLGEAKLPGIAVADIGRCAIGVFLRRSEFVGRTIGICAEELTGAEIAAALGCRYEPIESEDPALSLFRYKRDFEQYHRSRRDVALSRALNPSLLTFRQWLASSAAAPLRSRDRRT